MQKILAAFDKCKDSLAAKELCMLAKKTLEEEGQEYIVDMVPLTDGGEGFVEIQRTEEIILLKKQKKIHHLKMI